MAAEGQLLTGTNSLADVDGIPISGPGAITVQWKSNGTAIAGATANTYLLTAKDVGTTITFTASYTDGFGTAESVTSLPTAAVLSSDTTPPALSGIGLSGSTVALTFSEALSASGLPTASAFAVQTVSGSTVSSRTVSGVALDSTDPTGRRLLLTLGGTAPASNVDLRVSYTDPSGNQATGVLQDQLGNDVASFTNQYATTFSTSASVTTLAANYSTLILSGSSAINGMGNAAANIILGNSAVNVITGGAGVDSMNGGSGGDIYVVANASEHTAAEISDTGIVVDGSIDELRFSATSTSAGATLSVDAGDTGLERVIIGTGTGTTATTTGTTALNINAQAAPNNLEITGNNGANALSGTAFADTINGLGGNDTLTGGSGADVFRFTSTPKATSNRDLITDFATGSDTLSFSRAIYAGFTSTDTALTNTQFLSGAGVTTATSTAQRFLYDTTSGLLSYDRDGFGSTYAPIQVAVLGSSTHPALAYTDFGLTA